jgi:hypothetical protein
MRITSGALVYGTIAHYIMGRGLGIMRFRISGGAMELPFWRGFSAIWLFLRPFLLLGAVYLLRSE